MKNNFSSVGCEIIDLFYLKNKKEKKKIWAGLPVQWYVEKVLFSKKPTSIEKDLKKYSKADQMATLIELVARATAEQYKSQGHKIEALFLYGHGSLHPNLKKRMQYHLPHIQVFALENLSQLI